MIDIPHVLVLRYIEAKRLGPGDVRRGDVFAWTLGVHLATSKCVFFQPELHGCRIYMDNLDTRPPQCAVYPAGYVNGAAACKAGAGPWIVKETAVGVTCERLMKVYKNFCLNERESIKHELIDHLADRLGERFNALLRKTPPRDIAGVKETWDGFEPLLAEGKSLSFKKFCKVSCPTPFFECNSPCEPAIDAFVFFLAEAMPGFIADRDMKEDYTIMELKEFLVIFQKKK